MLCCCMTDHKRVWHSGSVSTCKTQVWLYPQRSYGIFVSLSGPNLDNTSAGLTRIMRHISDILLLNEPPTHNLSNLCPLPPPFSSLNPPRIDDSLDGAVHAEPAELPRATQAYTGVYRNSAFGAITISYNNSVK